MDKRFPQRSYITKAAQLIAHIQAYKSPTPFID